MSNPQKPSYFSDLKHLVVQCLRGALLVFCGLITVGSGICAAISVEPLGVGIAGIAAAVALSFGYFCRALWRSIRRATRLWYAVEAAPDSQPGMQVIAHVPSEWFLLDDEGQLYLDVRVERGATAFSVTNPLTPGQRADYEIEGIAFIERLAQEMRYQALYGQWVAPELPEDFNDRFMDAVMRWQRRDKL